MKAAKYCPSRSVKSTKNSFLFIRKKLFSSPLTTGILRMRSNYAQDGGVYAIVHTSMRFFNFQSMFIIIFNAFNTFQHSQQNRNTYWQKQRNIHGIPMEKKWLGTVGIKQAQ